MRLREAVASVLHLCTVLLFLALGALSIFLVHRPDWNLMAQTSLAERPDLFYWIGGGFGGIGLFFLFAFFKVDGGRYLRLKLSFGETAIDSRIIRQAVEECFRRNYPLEIRGTCISVIGGRRLQVALDLASLDEEKQLELLSDVEDKLIELLRSQFGYRESFLLFVRSS